MRQQQQKLKNKKLKQLQTKELERLDTHASGTEDDKSINMTKKMNKIIDRNKELENIVTEKKKMLARKDYEKNEINKKVERLTDLLSKRTSKIEAISELSELPGTLSGAIKLIESIFPDKIVFSEEAKKSAEAASNVSIDIAWPCLFKMATTLHELFFVESEKEGIDIEKEFQDRT